MQTPYDEAIDYLLAPLADDLNNPKNNEVSIIAPGKVAVFGSGHWTLKDVPELDYERLESLGLQVARRTSSDADFDPKRPMLGATLPGDRRIHIARPPATLGDTIAASIRLPPREIKPRDTSYLKAMFAESNTGLDRRSQSDALGLRLFREKNWEEFFPWCARTRQNGAVCGMMMGGKTYLTRNVMTWLPDDRRFATVQRNNEFGNIGPVNRFDVFCDEANPDRTALKCFEFCLGMCVESVWFQEVRGAESYPLSRAALAGARGGWTTWHAERGKEFETFALMLAQSPEGRAIPPEKREAYVKSCFDVVVWVDREEDVFSAPDVWFKPDAELRAREAQDQAA